MGQTRSVAREAGLDVRSFQSVAEPYSGAQAYMNFPRGDVSKQERQIMEQARRYLEQIEKS